MPKPYWRKYVADNMKRVLTEKVLEEASYFCDKHPDRECFSEVKTASWYGSKFDECLEELYKEFQQKYGIKPHDIDI